MSIILQDQLTLSTETKEQVEKNTQDIAELEQKISTVYKFKGTVEKYSDLPPAPENEVGDVWDVQENGMNYAWAESEESGESGESGRWDQLGPTIDLSGYVQKTTEINGHALSSDINLNATDVGAQETLVSGTNIKTINGNSILGDGNLELTQYLGFPSDWPTTNATTTKQFCDIVAADVDAIEGKMYLGEVRWSDLPASMVNAEVTVSIMKGKEGEPSSNKVIVLNMTSGNRAPYQWQYTYWNNGSNISGWIGFQPELTPGTGITINNNTISADLMVGSDGTTAGSAGIVPAPAATDNTKFLRGDGTWTEVQTDIALPDIAEAGSGIAFTGGAPVTVQNFTVEGSPIITDGVASNFSKYNYLKANYHFDASDKPWKFNFKFTPTHVSGHDSIIGGEWNTLNEPFMLIRLVSGRMLIMMTDLSNPSTNFINNTGTYSFTNNKTYYGEVGYDGTKYYSKYKQSGSDTWTPDMNITSSSLLNDGYFVIGTLLYSGSGSGGEYFQGSIDLNEFSVEINNEVVWTPYTEIPASKTTISATTMTGATGVVAGTSGMVPAPSATDNVKFLKGDGTWSEVKQLEAYQSLTAAQRTILLNNGTYDGKAVESNTIFTQYDGTFQNFTKEAVTEDSAFVADGSFIDTNFYPFFISKGKDLNDNDLYMAIAIDTYYTPVYTGSDITDDTTWAARNGTAGVSLLVHQGALYKNHVWVVADASYYCIRYSEDDGDTWTSVDNCPIYPEQQFSLCNDYFVACNYNYEPYISADGKNWTQLQTGAGDVTNIVYDDQNEQYVLITRWSKKIYTNPDITNNNGWTEVTPVQAPHDGEYVTIAYNNGIYYLNVTDTINYTIITRIDTSTDLLNWTHYDYVFPQKATGWEGGYPKFFCLNNTVCFEVDKTLFITTTNGEYWTKAITSNGASSLVDMCLYNIDHGNIQKLNITTHPGYILRELSYTIKDINNLLNTKQNVLSQGDGILINPETNTISIHIRAIEGAPDKDTYGYLGESVVDYTNYKAYTCAGYNSELEGYVWEAQGGSTATYNANTETIKF